jgi:hypothetical protein
MVNGVTFLRCLERVVFHAFHYHVILQNVTVLLKVARKLSSVLASQTEGHEFFNFVLVANL